MYMPKNKKKNKQQKNARRDISSAGQTGAWIHEWTVPWVQREGRANNADSSFNTAGYEVDGIKTHAALVCMTGSHHWEITRSKAKGSKRSGPSLYLPDSVTLTIVIKNNYGDIERGGGFEPSPKDLQHLLSRNNTSVMALS